ncbi:MAG: hypothetical protein ABEJ69_00730 [Candidatus Nanohaloarchaea archaeon]
MELMKVGVVELVNEHSLGNHAVAQLQEMGFNVEREEVEQLIDLPGKAQRISEECDGLLVLADVTNKEFVDETVEALLRVELDTGKPVHKVIEEKGYQDRHHFQEDITETARQRAEEIAEEIR